MRTLILIFVLIIFISAAPTRPKPVKVDDFLIAIGKTKSNSVYHVAAVKKGRQKNRMVRYYLQVFKSDLPTAMKRDKSQRIIAVTWYSRKKKK